MTLYATCVSEKQVNAEQDQLLKSAFSLLDFDGDGKLGEDEFRTLLRYTSKRIKRGCSALIR